MRFDGVEDSHPSGGALNARCSIEVESTLNKTRPIRKDGAGAHSLGLQVVPLEGCEFAHEDYRGGNEAVTLEDQSLAVGGPTRIGTMLVAADICEGFGFAGGKIHHPDIIAFIDFAIVSEVLAVGRDYAGGFMIAGVAKRVDVTGGDRAQQDALVGGDAFVDDVVGIAKQIIVRVE